MKNERACAENMGANVCVPTSDGRTIRPCTQDPHLPATAFGPHCRNASQGRIFASELSYSQRALQYRGLLDLARGGLSFIRYWYRQNGKGGSSLVSDPTLAARFQKHSTGRAHTRTLPR